MEASGWRPGESVSDARSRDLFGLDDLLTEEEREVRERVRAFSDAEERHPLRIPRRPPLG
jgi:hypothetical protein